MLEPGGTFQMADEREKGAVYVLRGTEKAQARMRLGGKPLSPTIVAEIIERTDGVPLFVE
jgi:hypothetical protein